MAQRRKVRELRGPSFQAKERHREAQEWAAFEAERAAVLRVLGVAGLLLAVAVYGLLALAGVLGSLT